MDNIITKWSQVLSILKKELLSAPYSSWIQPLDPVSFDEKNKTLTLRTTEYALSIINNRYKPMIEIAAREVFDSDIVLNFEVSPQTYPVLSFNDGSRNRDSIWEYPENDDTCLNQRYQFNTFVVGANNELAYAACLAVANGPVSTSSNPLFIYGNSGLGKTHLMQAIGHHVLSGDPTKKILYVSSEVFTNELIDSLKNQRMDEFRSKYRNVDYLLIDDIQFIEKKERTQEELFHTFNTLYQSNKQIVFTSDRPPKDIATINQRLRSRFEGGLPVDIQQPDFETRVAILKNKAEMEDIYMDNDNDLLEIFYIIAENITTNIRELEGALNRVIHHATLTNKPLNKQTAVEALQDLFVMQDRVVDIHLIQSIVCSHFNISLQEMNSSKRSKNISHPRQIAMYLCRELTDESYPQIASSFEKKDHTTILYAYEKISSDMESDSELAATIEELKMKIMNK